MKKIIFVLNCLVAFFSFTGCNYAGNSFNPNAVKCHIITYVTDKGTAPEQIAVASGANLTSSQLAPLTHEKGYYDFDGWYIGAIKIYPGFEVTQNLTLTAKWNFVKYEYNVNDTSSKNVGTSSSTTFSVDGDGIKAVYSSYSSSINNWMLTSIAPENAYGFEEKVKANSQMSFVGIQWLNSSGESGTTYNCYYFEITGDGKFLIRSHIGDKWETYYSKSDYVVSGDFNVMKMTATKTSDFECYINGHLVYTIKKEDLKITPGKLAYAVSPAKGTSSSKKAEGWMKLLNYQSIK